MRLEAKPHFVELRVTEICPDDSPRPGDARLEVSFRVGDLGGRCVCWIDADERRTFAAAVELLYTEFRGSASLVSMSPRELSFSLSPANSRGYVYVNVSLMKQSIDASGSASGSFELELPALSALVRWAQSPDVEDA